MKKIYCVILSIIILLTSSFITLSATDIKGDVNKDNKVNSEDALLILKCSVGSVLPSDFDYVLADITCDDVINSADALMVLQIAVGKLQTPEITTEIKKTTTTRAASDEDSNVEKLIALTFDDGPYPEVTNRILDTLEQYGAKATFFVVGNRIEKYKSTVKRTHSLGCEIGSHTWSHTNLTKLTLDQMNSEINKSIEAITAVTGEPVNLIRPPEGVINSTVQANLRYPIIMWSVDSMDWKYRDATKNYNTVVNSVFDGSIIQMHDLYHATADAVAKLIPDLMAKGYKFVTVSELMEARGITMQNGKTYSQARS